MLTKYVNSKQAGRAFALHLHDFSFICSYPANEDLKVWVMQKKGSSSSFASVLISNSEIHSFEMSFQLPRPAVLILLTQGNGLSSVLLPFCLEAFCWKNFFVIFYHNLSTTKIYWCNKLRFYGLAMFIWARDFPSNVRMFCCISWYKSSSIENLTLSVFASTPWKSLLVPRSSRCNG